MNRKPVAQQKKAALVNTLSQGRVMQRKCACGTHNGASETCGSCQATAASTLVQRQAEADVAANQTDMPGALKSGLEALSGMDLSAVRVHTNSSKPAQLNAFAYTQGHDIHLGPGHEQHLPHEAWHVVQQMQRRVQPTLEARGRIPINDDAGLEREADVMGAKALQLNWAEHAKTPLQRNLGRSEPRPSVQMQRRDGASSVDASDVDEEHQNQNTRSSTQYRIRVVGHASPRWRRPGASTQELRNLSLSERRARAVEGSLRSFFRASERPIEFNLTCDVIDADSDSLNVDWRGMADTVAEADDDHDANDPAFRRVDIEVNVLESTTEVGGYTEVVTLPTATTRWSIKADVFEGAIGAAGSMGVGDLRNRETGQKVKGRWMAGGGGGGIDLPIPSVAPGSWTNFETVKPVTFHNFNDTLVRLTSIAAGVGIGYGTAEFTFTELMDESVTLHGVAFNQWGVGGSVTAGSWNFTQRIPLAPTELREHSIEYPTTAGVQFGHRVSFPTAVDSISIPELGALQEFVERLP